MKQLLLSVLLLLLISPSVYSQDDCDYKFSVPDELYRGRYNPEGMVYGHPYTMFNKRKANWSLESDLKVIRNSILGHVEAGHPYGYAALYAEIYKNAKSNRPGHCMEDRQECPYAKWVKNNAIVHLVGIKYDTTSLGVDTFIYISDWQSSFRSSFAERAAQGLRDLNPRIISCWGGADCDVIKSKAFDLINFLQAYDLLKAAKYYPIDDGDRNNGDCSGRNKLREFTRNFYEESKHVINSNLGWKKNHGIIAGSALGMAAIVLHEAGVETEWGRGLLGVFNHNGFHIPRPNYSPLNWQLRADGSAEEKEDGIDDCMFHGTHMWPSKDVPQTNATGTAGFAEGPDYATYMFSALAPYMRTYANFLPSTSGKYLDDPRFIEIMKWYLNICKQNGHNPTYDNSRNAPYTLGVLGIPEWNGNAVNGANDIDLQGDLLLALGMDTVTKSKYYVQNTYVNEASGNLIVRSNTPKGQYFFQLLFEHDVAVDKQATFADDTHEDEDFGSFILDVDGENLAIDPPYLGFPFHVWTDQFNKHNYAAFATEDAVFKNQDVTRKSNSNLTLFYEQWKPRIVLHDIHYGDVRRNVKLFTTGINSYYMLYDRFSASDDDAADEDVKLSINGNGNIDESTFLRTGNTETETYDANGRIFRWEHPFTTDRPNPWGLLAHVAMVDFGTPTFTLQSTGTDHGQAGLITNSKGKHNKDDTPGAKEGQTSNDYGLHTRLKISQPSETAVIQTVLYPYKHEEILPRINRVENSNYVTTLLRFNTPLDTALESTDGTPHVPATVDDSTRDFHFARYWGGLFPISNPFMVDGDTSILTTNAEKAFMSVSDFRFDRVGACAPSFIRFKKAEIDEGNNLTYNDTLYINATNLATAYYEYAGKFRYTGYVYSETTTSITFFLPDLQLGYEMQGKIDEKSNLTTHHLYYSNTNDTFKYVTIDFPQGTTYFTIEIKDPCVADCFFPPTAVTINKLFHFRTGMQNALGHDLDIVQGNGNLSISNASRMYICPDNVLANKDSLIMGLECVPEKRWLIGEDGTRRYLPGDSLKYFCNRKDLLKDREVNTTRNTIIVNDKAGLVLDSGSVTHIGLNSTILIRPGGTLLIKAGATVIIGDSSCISNRGELLADNGAYVCIEEGANMFFFNDIDSTNFYNTDTLDRHIVYIAMPDSLGHGGAIPGRNPAGGRNKFIPSKDGVPGTWSAGACLDFCALIFKNPPYGVNNRPFGWCNVGLPRALFTAPDTLCIGHQYNIDGTPSLNETGYSILLCKYDTGSRTCMSIIDSIVDNGDNCLSYRYLFTPTESGYYRTRLIVHNDCSQTDTFSKLLYVPPSPVAYFTAPDSICPGVGVLSANGSLSASYLPRCKHRWTVEPLFEDTDNIDLLNDTSVVIRDWTIDSTAVSSAFGFPGYKFAGGMKYLISLVVKGWCKDSIWNDTVWVPLKVSINLEHATSYENPIGPTPVRLIGIVKNAQSWSWSPTDYLDTATSLTPVTTPPGPIVYVLTGTLNGCSLTDTITISYNRMANAGEDRGICQNDITVLGSEFNAALFLGSYYFTQEDQFASLYGEFYGYNLDFHKYFSTYLLKTLKGVYTSNDLLTNFSTQMDYHEKVFARPWFKDYFQLFIDSKADQEAFELFGDSLTADVELREILGIDDNLGPLGINWDHDQMQSLFQGFQNYINGNRQDATEIIWEQQRRPNQSWDQLPDWNDNMNIYVAGDTTQIYRITALDDDLGIVEYDYVFLTIDSIVNPSFSVNYQEDSTVYFADETLPFRTYYRYSWNFGDGTTSDARHPIHSFPAFDSLYRVCLSVTNSCGTYTTCDTVAVDSVGLINGFNKKALNTEPGPIKITKETKQSLLAQTKGNVLLDNVPSPFTDITSITYSINQPYNTASIRITDVLGRIIQEQPLRSSKGKIFFDGSAHPGGLYYTSLIIEGVVIKNKTMLIQR
jgi:hypothetical protein